MKVFTQINNLINKFVQDGQRIGYLGTVYMDEMDDEDKTELLMWNAVNETVYEKRIGQYLFHFHLADNG